SITFSPLEYSLSILFSYIVDKSHYGTRVDENADKKRRSFLISSSRPTFHSISICFVPPPKYHPFTLINLSQNSSCSTSYYHWKYIQSSIYFLLFFLLHTYFLLLRLFNIMDGNFDIRCNTNFHEFSYG